MFAPPLKIPKPKAASQTVPTRAPDARQHRPWPSGWGAAEQMRNLPQLIGNQAMLRLLSQQAQSVTVGTADQAVQAKLKIGAIDDPLEHEADRVAEAVLASAPVPAPSRAPGLLQRKCPACEEEEKQQHETVRRAAMPGSGMAQSSCQNGPAGPEVVAAVSQGGAPLSADLRSYFEPRFGHYFSRVRIHDNAAAGAAAQSINARAFTLGRDIAFAPGEYAPGTAQGRRLLAHELAHVVQQADTPASPYVMRKAYPGCDKRTTGMDDASAHIDLARAEALKMITDARAAFPRMSPRTIRLADNHFHCPSSSDILTVMKTLDAIKKTIPLLGVRCMSASDRRCRIAPITRITRPDNILSLCPPSSYDDLSDLAGEFVWGAGVSAGLAPECQGATSCLSDFTIVASDRVKQADAYRSFAIEYADYPVFQPRTIPCAPHGTGVYVSVYPGLLNPREIRPVTGYEPTPPAGSRILEVFEDRAGKKFIYFDHPNAETYLPNEPKRFYFPLGFPPR